MKSLYVLWHLGLGDAIICNGLIRKLRETWDSIYVPSWFHNITSVKFMFRDDKDIHVIPVTSDQDAINYSIKQSNVIRLGCYRKDFDRVEWDREFYRHAGLDFEECHKSFKIVRNNAIEYPKPKTSFAFVHDDYHRGYNIRDTEIHTETAVRPHRTDNIFDWCGCIEGAEELHCIDSSLIWLCDQIRNDKENKYVHNYARPSILPKTLNERWKVIK